MALKPITVDHQHLEGKIDCESHDIFGDLEHESVWAIFAAVLRQKNVREEGHLLPVLAIEHEAKEGLTESQSEHHRQTCGFVEGKEVSSKVLRNFQQVTKLSCVVDLDVAAQDDPRKKALPDELNYEQRCQPLQQLPKLRDPMLAFCGKK